MMEDTPQRRDRMLVVALILVAAAGCRHDIAGGDDPTSATDTGTTGPSSATDASAGSSTSGGPQDPPPDECTDVSGDAAPLVRRLTADEYANTIEDVLGVDVRADVAATLPRDIRVDGFNNTASAQIVTFDHARAYYELAQTIVERMPSASAFAAEHASCMDFERACEDELVANVGLVLWRRPLTDHEIASFGPLFDAVQEEGDPFEIASDLVLRTMLQSPQFLYRLEDEAPDADGGPTRALDDYEIASRLSYLVWNSAPDDTLYTAAAQGQLQDTEEIEAQVDRMLEHPRARETSIRYISQWLALDDVENIHRDPVLHADFSSELAAAMAEETRRLFEHLVWEARAPIVDILTTEYTFLSPELAELYGLQAQGDDWALYDLRELDERVGVLTHAGVLALSAHGNRPSIVERGLFVLRSVLCADITAPPGDLDTSMADVDPDASEREKSEARLDNGTCAGCHAQFDPLAYGFEQFSAIGTWRETDDLGHVLRSDGTFVRPGTGEPIPYEDVAELVDIIAADGGARDCVGLRKPLQFAIGRPLEPSDACAIENITQTLGEGGGTYQDLLKALATQPSFRRIRTP